MPLEKQFDPDEALERAMTAFWDRGYGATSMQDLVDATGINRASLYATFEDKHALFLAALRHYCRTVHFRRLADLEQRHPPLEAIRRALMAFVPGDRSKRHPGCFITNTALELSAHDPEARELVARAQRQTRAWFERQLRRAAERGEVAPGVRPDEAAESLLASLIGLSVLYRSQPAPAAARRIVAGALRSLT